MIASDVDLISFRYFSERKYDSSIILNKFKIDMGIDVLRN
jgi:hypothetical protein